MDLNLEENQMPATPQIPESQAESQGEKSELPVEQSSEELQESQTKIEKGLTDLVKAQAIQYQYIERLENEIFSDGRVDENEVQNVSFCKSQVLLQLVSIESFAAGLDAKDPRRTAVDALLSHLYKCYDKTEKLRSKAQAGKFQSDYEKEVAEEKFGCRRRRPVTDEMLKPTDRHIHLMVPAISLAGMSFLKDFLTNPEERIKAQMDDLIEEFQTKTSSEEKDFSKLWSESLVSELSKIKGVQSMIHALEGKNIIPTVKQMAGSKGF